MHDLRFRCIETLHFLQCVEDSWTESEAHWALHSGVFVVPIMLHPRHVNIPTVHIYGQTLLAIDGSDP